MFMIFLFYISDYGKDFDLILFLINNYNSQRKENEPLCTNKYTEDIMNKSRQKVYASIYVVGWHIFKARIIIYFHINLTASDLVHIRTKWDYYGKKMLESSESSPAVENMGPV